MEEKSEFLFLTRLLVSSHFVAHLRIADFLYIISL